MLRQKYRREILVHHARPLERALDGVSVADLLDGDALDLVGLLPIHARSGVGRGNRLIAEARWPHGERRYLDALADYARLDVHLVTVIKPEALADGYVAIGVFERDLARRFHRTRFARHIQHRIQLSAQRFVVGVQRERVA